MALDIRALARATYDPRQFPGAYSDEKRRLGDFAAQRQLALVSAPNSVAALNNNPDDPRSIAAQQLPGMYGPGPLAALLAPHQQQQQQEQPQLVSGVDDMMRTSDTLSYNGRGASRKKRFSFDSEI